jgi:hypothetical protein
VVDKDNTVAIKDCRWQIEKCRWRYSLADRTVTIHQHLNGTVSIRFGPHVVGRYAESGRPLEPPKRPWKKTVPWKPWKPNPGFPPLPPPLGKLATSASFPLSHRLATPFSPLSRKPKAKRVA